MKMLSRVVTMAVLAASTAFSQKAAPSPGLKDAKSPPSLSPVKGFNVPTDRSFSEMTNLQKFEYARDLMNEAVTVDAGICATYTEREGRSNGYPGDQAELLADMAERHATTFSHLHQVQEIVGRIVQSIANEAYSLSQDQLSVTYASFTRIQNLTFRPTGFFPHLRGKVDELLDQYEVESDALDDAIEELGNSLR